MEKIITKKRQRSGEANCFQKKLSPLSNSLELLIENVPFDLASSVKSLGTFDENLRLI